MREPVPINVECVKAFKKVVNYTNELRKESDNDKTSEYLFIYRPKSGIKANKLTVPTSRAFNDWLRRFCKNHNIVDSNGEIADITNHQFRRTLATDMLSKGIDLQSVGNLLGHEDLRNTAKFYADIKDKERGEVFLKVGIIGNINDVNSETIPNQEDYQWFLQNKDKKAKLRNGYCTKPLLDDEEICTTYLKMQKCFGCHRYITTPAFLEEHKKHLAELEEEVALNRIYGEHFIKHHQPTIAILKDIVKKLEGLNEK